MRQRSVYIHIPFCKRRCNYCAFLSSCDFSIEDDYVEALCREMDVCAADDCRISTVFIGGGTPSTLSEKNIDKVFASLKRNFVIESGAEITIEANPESFDMKKAEAFARNGVNRVSFGLQSVNDKTLTTIGRSHTFGDFTGAVDRALSIGITNLNADLIVGLPESNADFLRSVQKIAQMPLKHVSVYALELHEGTLLQKAVERGDCVLADDDELADRYDRATELLEANGFARYEISNFAKEGFECRHNLTYWRADEYFGLGAGAHGYVRGVRAHNVAEVKSYVKQVLQDGIPKKEDVEEIDETERMRETVMLGLRLKNGVSTSEFFQKFGVRPSDVFPQINRLVSGGFLTFDGNRLVVPEDKFYVLNEILVELL